MMKVESEPVIVISDDDDGKYGSGRPPTPPHEPPGAVAKSTWRSPAQPKPEPQTTEPEANGTGLREEGGAQGEEIGSREEPHSEEAKQVKGEGLQADLPAETEVLDLSDLDDIPTQSFEGVQPVDDADVLQLLQQFGQPNGDQAKRHRDSIGEGEPLQAKRRTETWTPAINSASPSPETPLNDHSVEASELALLERDLSPVQNTQLHLEDPNETSATNTELDTELAQLEAAGEFDRMAESVEPGEFGDTLHNDDLDREVQALDYHALAGGLEESPPGNDEVVVISDEDSELYQDALLYRQAPLNSPPPPHENLHQPLQPPPDHMYYVDDEEPAEQQEEAVEDEEYFVDSDGEEIPVEEKNGLSDDEIAVLTKEEAERLGLFKASSFDASRLYNRPVPISPATQLSSEDMAIRSYFDKYSLPQLQQHESNLHGQLTSLNTTRDGVLGEVTSLRSRISMLSYDQVSLRGELLRLISDKLRLAEDTINRARKVRRYQAILNTVKDYKMFPGKKMMFDPGAPQYGSSVNPYVQSRTNEDHVHLQQLFADIYKEEKIEGMAETPEGLTIQLLDHQRQGLFWLLKREKSDSGCILADDMGLGKTVQTIALMMANKPQDDEPKTTLIVGPVSLLRQWAAEFKAKIKRTHALKVGFFHGEGRKKLSTFKKIRSYDVVLTSYTTLASEYKQHFALAIEQAQVSRNQNVLPDLNAGGQDYVSPFYSSDAVFHRVVLDEAQYIKNKLSQTSKATACLKGKHRLCLTGTPMQNNIDELYPLLRFLRVRPYDDEKKFKADISVPLKASGETFDEYDKNQSMRKLRAILLAVMLRRTKDSKVDGKPLIQLPEKTIEQVFVKMEKDEEEEYRSLEKGIQKKAQKLMNTKALSYGNFLTLLLRLRQACVHQLLVEVGELNSAERAGHTGLTWDKMFRRSTDLSAEVINNVRETVVANTIKTSDDLDVAGDLQYSCPMCFDTVSEDSVVVLGNCGHLICDECISTSDDKADSFCVVCNTAFHKSDLIDYGMFKKVIDEGCTYKDLERVYGPVNVRKTTTQEKVAMLMRRNDGFMPLAKIQKTLDLVQSIIDDTPDEKIIIFSHFTVTFDLMGHAFKQDLIKYLRYDGSMSIDEKNEVISKFYKGPARVLLISLKAGNVGLTLTCASHVVIMDPFWNPYVEDQAMDRAHRFGQQRPVKVYRLLIKNSVEDRITELQQRKKELISSALDESALKTSSHLGRTELGYLFGLNGLGLG